MWLVVLRFFFRHFVEYTNTESVEKKMSVVVFYSKETSLLTCDEIKTKSWRGEKWIERWVNERVINTSLSLTSCTVRKCDWRANERDSLKNSVSLCMCLIVWCECRQNAMFIAWAIVDSSCCWHHAICVMSYYKSKEKIYYSAHRFAKYKPI